MTPARICLIAAAIIVAVASPLRAGECEVKRVIRLDTNIPDVTVVTRNGETMELRDVIEAFVVPAKIPVGVYEVSVRRKASNLYEIRGKDLEVETRYCYEYAYGQDAVLKITSTSGGWSIGKLIFE